jgi:hypothetical protein
MVQNVEPIFPRIPNVSTTDAMTTANTTKDLTAGTIALAFTAGADGAFIESIVGQPLGTNVASLARVFLNNGLTTATATNNMLIGQIGLPAITNSETSEVASVSFAVNRAIPAGWRVYITLATAVAAGWEFTTFGGNY